jgi:threonine dehydratase
VTTVDLAAIQQAAVSGREVVKRTPVVPSTTLTEALGNNIVLKAENLQRTGAFKIRGAMHKLATLGEAAAGGVTAGSAGNHAQAVAFAAARFGVACDIFVPTGAAISKIEACRALGATVHEVGSTITDALAAAQQRAETTGMAFCHPFDDPAVVAGQGTLGLELVEDIADLACVVVPIGGGGLSSGIAIAVKSLRPEVRVIGVQAEACPGFLDRPPADGPIVTLADGIAVKHPGAITRPLVERWVDEIVTAGEDAIADAMVMLMDRAKLFVEGAGAVGVAALMGGAAQPAERGTTCVVLSGGNVDLGVVPGLIRRHETQAGRRLTVFVRIDDRPGGLASLLGIFAAIGANLLEVQHVREGLDLHVRETGVRASFEVRDRQHAQDAVAAARQAGYPVTVE